MQRNQIRIALGVACAAACWPALAAAQTATSDELMALDNTALKSELTSRYDGALAATQDTAIVAADNPTYLWASQAKAQCGIALGFMKSGTRDPVSIGKCVDATNRMRPAGPAAPVEYVATPAEPVACGKGPFIVFFDWDSSAITPDAAQILDSMIASYAGCGNAAVTASGYADRSGSDRYNQGLSVRRAEAVRSYLASRSVSGGGITAQGFGESNPRVPTADGVRELQNRRVEITVN
ncbi:MAG: OmpA family protein [Novosphingobium sp.]